MIIESSTLRGRDGYKLLIGSVIPRPIAWVSTIARDGSLNLAPFSFFQAVCGDPPTLIVSVGPRAEGGPKDSARNALESGEFVVNIVNMDLAEPMNLTAGDYPYGVDEFELSGVTPVPSHLVQAPRVAEAPVAFECRLKHTVNVGPDAAPHTVMFGEVIAFYVRDDLYENGRIDALRLAPVGRLAGDQYMKPGEIFEMARPKYQETRS